VGSERPRMSRDEDDEVLSGDPWENDPFESLDLPARKHRPAPRRRRQPRERDAATWRQELSALGRTATGRRLIASVGLLLVLTIVGLIALWPGSTPSSGPSQAFGGTTLPATVAAERIVSCPGPVSQECRQIQISVTGGEEAGAHASIALGPTASTPDVPAGSSIRVIHVVPPPGASPSAIPKGAPQYQFVDFDRHSELLWLVIVFLVLVVAVARWRGLLAMVGFGLSLALVMKFLVPAILAGSSPFLVALVGALTVMFVTLALTSGVGTQSLAAALGIAGSLILAALLGEIWAHLAHLNGLNSELATVVPQAGIHVSLQGIVIAGMVVGALGVIADMAVTQASAVMALRRANPGLSPRALYGEAFIVGRDHLSATINTLVLAYVGASLPLLLILSATSVGINDALNSQDVAGPIIATLVGSIGLLAAVPLTTGLTALLVSRLPTEALPTHAHVH
jgi:uncharacterized membrane protein